MSQDIFVPCFVIIANTSKDILYDSRYSVEVHFLLIYICNFHVLNHFLLIYKLHLNFQRLFSPSDVYDAGYVYSGDMSVYCPGQVFTLSSWSILFLVFNGHCLSCFNKSHEKVEFFTVSNSLSISNFTVAEFNKFIFDSHISGKNYSGKNYFHLIYICNSQCLK